jgi:hypothetical protein
MNIKIIIASLTLMLAVWKTNAQTTDTTKVNAHPKREFRCAWIVLLWRFITHENSKQVTIRERHSKESPNSLLIMVGINCTGRLLRYQHS